MILERKAMVAGFLIGLGVIINTLATNPILGAVLFSFGLLTIIEMQLPLYTGQIGFIKEKKKSDLIKIIICNFIGILFILCLKNLSDPNFQSIFVEKAILKFNKDIFRMFIDGFFCGMLIHFAVKCKKPLLTTMAVVIFILTGSEHCIADFPYLWYAPSLLNLLKFFMVIMGNSLGAILLENMLKKEGKK